MTHLGVSRTDDTEESNFGVVGADERVVLREESRTERRRDKPSNLQQLNNYDAVETYTGISIIKEAFNTGTQIMMGG